MGTGTFFSKMASGDVIAHTLHLPGSDKYAQLQAKQDAGNSSRGPYQGVDATLAGANAGYAAGGPGSNASYTPWTASRPGGAFGFAQRLAASTGSMTPNGASGQWTPNPKTVNNNPWGS